ncbi:FAD-binding protein [Clostridium magnum]|uniref:Acryloyl-CoA reductase electron transfer subunit beta n=1 Tax=Clostridium magnum DSM 2767 TaxID=1121326 RepID=A0A168DU09_9CLOT|nr:FAD-binding protein [Clostridium magnum]KZL91469.1 acryloyl-CoA reductase electron transfer subunit beta [Clostridium magnum DSM 2767]SHH43530.1 electron transfer flavoprotein alpha subunit apoprotein [Clostridium magnum DSM 2767]
MAVIIADSCNGCELCIPSCPFDALEISGEGKLVASKEKCIECGKCVSVCPISSLNILGDKKKAKGNLGKETNKNHMDLKIEKPTGDVWVFAEQFEGKLASVTLELIGEAKKVSLKLDVKVCAVLLGDKVESIILELFAHGADTVYVIDDEVFHFYRSETYNRAFCYLIDKYKPEILLMGATTTGRDLAGAVATAMKTGLTADCTQLDIDLDKGVLLASRPAFGGNIMATIVCEKHRPQMATVRPRVMQMPEPEVNKTGSIIRESFKIEEKSLRTWVLEIIKEQSENAKLEDAKIIVCGGRGVQNQEGFKLLEELAKVIGGVVAGSRGAVEKGLVDYKRQVGQTGQTVSPKLYFAIGISGEIQHTVGVQGAETIVSINTDPECEMMKLATYGIQGDVFEVLPKLIISFKEALGDISSAKPEDLCAITKEV